MSKFSDLKAQSVDGLLQQQKLIDLISIRHLPRQVMLLDDNDNTLFNFEYPHFPYCRGLFTGPERYTNDVLSEIKKHMEQGTKIAELYFLGTRAEYSKVADTVARYKKSLPDAAKLPLETFYVEYDLNSLREDVVVHERRSTKGVSDEDAAVLDQHINDVDQLLEDFEQMGRV